MAGNFYYVDRVVDTDGLGSPYASNQVGNSFAALGDANVYGTVQQAIAAGATDDDTIVCAVEHAYTTPSVAITYAGGTNTSLRILCATNADCGIPSVGATEAITSSTLDFTFNKINSIDGLIMETDDIFFPSQISGSLSKIRNCRINVKSASKGIVFNGDGAYFESDNSIIDLYYNNSDILINAGSTFTMNGGSFASSVSGNINNLFLGGFVSGGGFVSLNEVDLSLVTGILIAGTGGNLTSDDTIAVYIDKCTLAPGVVFHDETFKGNNQKILVTQSSSNSASAEYQYYYHTRGGSVEQATNIWRDESEPFFLSNKKVSLQAIGNSDTEQSMAFEFDFPTRKAALSGLGSTDVIRIYLAVINTTILYDNDVWAELIYPDDTSKNVFNTVNSLGTPSDSPINILRTPALLPTDTGSNWKDAGGDLVGYNEYYLDLDTSINPGSDCIPRIRMHVALELAAGIYFDVTVGVVPS